MAAKVLTEQEVADLTPCDVTTCIGGITYRCGKTGPHDEHVTRAPEYAAVDWRAAFGHARPVLELISANEGKFDDRLVASARRALLFAQGTRVSRMPSMKPGLAKTRQ